MFPPLCLGELPTSRRRRAFRGGGWEGIGGHSIGGDGVKKFREVAYERGLKPKLFYTVNEVAQVTGMLDRDIRAEVNAGRLKAKVPLGKERGLCIKPEWVDSWSEVTE